MPDSSTQDFLEMEDIKEGILVLKNKGLRGILMVSSLNFALKSDNEQSAIIYAFQTFLNTLDFSCQIIVQSRRINITPYLDQLQSLEEKQTIELLKEQTATYRAFIKELAQGESIMTKNFFVVIPYNLMEALGIKGISRSFGLEKLFGKKKEDKQSPKTLTDEEFERCKTQLWQRMEFVAMGLRRCGLEAVPLTTPELIELFWSIHHPDQAEIGYYPEILPELVK